MGKKKGKKNVDTPSGAGGQQPMELEESAPVPKPQPLPSQPQQQQPLQTAAIPAQPVAGTSGQGRAPAKQPTGASQAQGAKPKPPKPAQAPSAGAAKQTPPELGELKLAPASIQRKPPKRPGQGTLGKPIALSANHFPVMIKAGKVYHYDVEIKETVTAVLKKKIVQEFIRTDRHLIDSRAVYDFKKNIYTARLITNNRGVPIGRCEIPFKLVETDRGDRTERLFTIILQPTGDVEIDLSALDAYLKSGTSVDMPLRAIQALEIAMKYAAACRPNMVSIGSCLLKLPEQGRIVSLGQGAEVYFGHFQSLRLTWQKTLNIDASQRAFASAGRMHEVMAATYGTRLGEPLQAWDFTDFSKKITNLKVSYPREKYTAKVGCNGLSKNSAANEKFDFEGRQISVQQFFETKQRIRLQFPHLPCVWVGSRERKSYVPMELCTILPGQEYRRKLTDVQTTNMIRNAATPAYVRKQRIMEAARDMNFNLDPTLSAFGISVASQMAQIQGRVLPAPTLVYGADERNTVVPKDGTWNMRNLRFVDAKAIGKFGVLNLTRVSQDQIGTFLGAIGRASSEMGMVFRRENWAFTRNTTMNSLENDMRTAKKMYSDLHLIFVIINRKGDPAYEIVKKVGDLELRLLTQCVQSKNVLGRQGPDPSTMANICLKLNAKMGGVNNLIQRDIRPKVLHEQVLILGADVTHPGADEGSTKPSIAAVVGSVDPKASQYCCEIRVQKSKQEFIEDMEGMVYNILRKYNRITGVKSTGKPQRIIFYRDGVSEGQFSQVMIHEIAAIQKACLRLEPDYKPPITFVVVQKRHHTRLFPNDKRDECGKGGNVPPGTVVDRDIVHPTEHDFYLVSHFGIQGTSRPTHYHVLWDDNLFSADELQKLTYYLCHMFSRCTRSVSYPAPCYYAHLVAFRGRQYFDSLTKERGSASVRELQSAIDASRDMTFMFFV